ncbi:UbiH/UbiF/VisC/COQ6 family ubiquinone biosynthesis hydroxylase [Sessilibacter sp. MAH4]
MDTEHNEQPNNTLYDVIIVGAGLVGACFASLLKSARGKNGQRLNIAVVEAGAPPKPVDLSSDSAVSESGFDPRVVALTRSSQDTLASIGAWKRVEALRCCPYTDMHVWDGDGTGSIHFNSFDIGETDLGHIVENSVALHGVLQTLANASNVEMIYGDGVEQLGGDQQQRSLILSSGRVLSAPLIVAADGSRSKIRELAAIAVRQWSYGHQAIVTTVQTERSHQFTAWQRFLSTGPLAFLPLHEATKGQNASHFCSIVWSLDTDVAEQMMALSDDEFKQELGRAFEHRLGDIVAVDKRYSLPLWQRHAREYIQPGLALIGDAAHSIHPLAGQGVNLGFLDAKVLAEEVIRAHKSGLNLNDFSLLRRFQRRRKGHNLAVMAIMEGFKRLFGARNLTVRLLRNIGIKQVDRLPLIKHTIAREILSSGKN